MIKGINKQMIVMKMEGNRIYDSVCFVLKNEVDRSKDGESDMLREANRILGEMDLKRSVKKKRRFFKKFLFFFVVLAVGIAIGFGLSFFV